MLFFVWLRSCFSCLNFRLHVLQVSFLGPDESSGDTTVSASVLLTLKPKSEPSIFCCSGRSSDESSSVAEPFARVGLPFPPRFLFELSLVVLFPVAGGEE